MTDRRGSGRRRLAAAALLGAGAVVATPRLRSRADLVREVAPDLRTWALLVPTHLDRPGRVRAARRLLSRPTPLADGVRVTEERTTLPDGQPGARVLRYEPERRARAGALVWVHGGGMVMGSPETTHDWASSVAAELGIPVVSVRYRLAPEHPFPAARDDVVEVVAWVQREADALGIDPTRVAIGGASAGGGLAASACQAARARDDVAIAFQLLVYPMLDDRTVGRGPSSALDALLWSGRSNRWAWAAYRGGTASDVDDPSAPAAPARCADLADLPPAWIGVGDIDLFHDEDERYAHGLRAAGVECELHVVPGMFHGADGVLPRRPTARAFRGAAIDALAAWLDGSTMSR
jgi:acetyl esterase/lipase